MKNYFEKLDNVVYNGITLKNMFKRFKIVDEGISSNLVEYIASPEQTLEEIANAIYGSKDYWWIIALTNNITDPLFDCPMDNENLAEKITYTYEMELATLGDLATQEEKDALYDKIFQVINEENIAKSKIKVIPGYMLIQFLLNLEYKGGV